MEDYIRYVLPSEMPLSFSYEALKAQAVCARTFTYGQMKNDTYARYGANLDDSIAYQAYHATTSYEVTDQAVADTAGMVMTYKGKLADCYYYSTSPGYSENLEVWNAASPGYLLAENHTREKTKDLSSDKAFHKFITAKADMYCLLPWFLKKESGRSKRKMKSGMHSESICWILILQTEPINIVPLPSRVRALK